jgi:hypothetical protein
LVNLTAILSTDILFYLSSAGASAGYANSGTVYSAPNGKYMSTMQISATALDNLFTDLTGAENAAGQVDYQCVFILNNTSGGDTALNGVVWLPLSGFVSGGANIALATDNVGATIKTSSSAQAATITTTTTAPTGISSWVSPSSTNAGGLSVPNLAPGYCFAVWIRRTATNSAPVNNDGFVLEYDFDTAN